MRFKTWLKQQERGTRAKMMRALGTHATALARAQRGLPVSYPNAEKICAMTLGEVTIASLCDPPKKRGAK